MTIAEIVSQKIDRMPYALQQEVLDFVEFVEKKYQRTLALEEVALLSEPALADWHNAEEEEAWKAYQ